jgi:hypothetical protein
LGKRRALCVGVNKFKYLPGAELRGCVNDVDDMKSILTKYLGFEGVGRDIVELTDFNATKHNIIDNLTEMVDGAKKGKYDYLVFSMSSHGTQVPDVNDEEDDRKDEAFCPTDLQIEGNIWHPNYIITDDELNELFIKLPENVALEVFLDTCHSGDGIKAVDLLLTRLPRYLPPPSLAAFEEVQKRSRSVGLVDILKSEDELREQGLIHHILWSACKPEQTASDAQIDGTWHGAFTYYFCKEMNESNNSLSREDLLTKVINDLKVEKFTQVPQLETEATRRNKSLP